MPVVPCLLVEGPACDTAEAILAVFAGPVAAAASPTFADSPDGAIFRFERGGRCFFAAVEFVRLGGGGIAGMLR